MKEEWKIHDEERGGRKSSSWPAESAARWEEKPARRGLVQAFAAG